MANPEHVEVVRKGAEAIAEWRRANPGVRLDLSGGDLRETKLDWADLSGAGLSGADLSGANVALANVIRADLSGANLSGADLSAASLLAAKLRRANLTGVEFFGANLTRADLLQADFSQARLGLTSLGRVDLSRVIGLGTVTHEFPSSVGVDTLIASFRGAGNRLTPELVTFFRGAGVPEALLKALPDIVREVRYYTCFIAYGQPDVGFARKLCEDLESRGVSCWLYDMDARVGERTWREITTRRREAEKTVVLCSHRALVRDGVLKEIEEQIDEDPEKLVPISLDDDWREPGFRVMRADRDLKPWLLERNYADFAGWEWDPSRYERGLEELLRGLRRKDG